MNRIQYPPVYFGLFFILSIPVLAVAGEASSSFTLVFNILFWPFIYGIGLAIGWHYRLRHSDTQKAISYVIIALAFILFMITSYASGWDKGFLYLLLCIQAGRNITLSTRRELYFALVISLILFLYAASISKETIFIFYIVLYALAGMFTLMVTHVDERLSLAKGGDKDFLINRINTPAKGIGLTVSVLCLSLFLYLVLPRLPSPHLQAFPAGGDKYYSNRAWKREALNSDQLKTNTHDKKVDKKNTGSAFQKKNDYSGSSSRMDICECSASLSNQIVFYLHSDRPVYSRGQVYDTFDGRFWYDSGIGSAKRHSRSGRFSFDKDYKGNGTVQVYSIEKDLPNHILTAYRPVVVQFPGDVIEQGHALSLKAPDTLTKGTVYSVLSDIVETDGRISGGRENLSDDMFSKRYLQLPETLSNEVKDLAFSVAGGLHNDYEKAKSVEQHLKKTYQYTIATAFMEHKDKPVETFLFDLKQGHCELFASSLAVMLRTLNIPSRLVTGYVASQYNPVTGYFEVRELNSHAWVEAYIDEYGWMTFEPTPQFLLSQTKKNYFVIMGLNAYLKERIHSALEAAPDAWWSRFMKVFLKIVSKVYMYLKMVLIAIIETVRAAALWVQNTGWKFLIPAAAVSAALYLLHLLLRPFMTKWALKRMHANASHHFIFSCYAYMEKIFAWKGAPRPLHYTPYEYKELLKIRFPDVLHEIELITSAFEQTKYGCYEISAAERDKAYRAYENILRNIVSLKEWRKKISNWKINKFS